MSSSAYKHAPGRPACAFGLNCYRRNPAHWHEFDHPADHEFLRLPLDQVQRADKREGECSNEDSKRVRRSEEAASSHGSREMVDLCDTTDDEEGAVATEGAPAAVATTVRAQTSVVIPSCYTNPVNLPRAPKPNAAPQPVRVRLPDPWVGDAGLLLCTFGSCTQPTPESAKIAGFDFDDTLSERKAAGGKDKWKSARAHARQTACQHAYCLSCAAKPVRRPCLPGTGSFWNHKFGSSQAAMLRALASRGYTLVVCTNESIDHLKNAQPLHDQLTPKLTRVAAWAADVGVPILALVAISKKTGVAPSGHTLHKQPRSAAGNAGMWHVAESLLGLAPGGGSGGDSFFVGDAAGREGDHGDDDRRLAASAGVRFFTDTEFFRGDPLQLLT